MSRFSIYETQWINLVFENRNKEYGAYQLRQESVKSSLSAFFMALLFITSIGAIATIARHFNTDTVPVITTPEWSDEVIHVTDVVIPIEEKTTLPQTQQQTTEVPVTQAILRDPIIVNPSEATPEVPVNTEITNTVNTTSEGNAGTAGNSTSSTGNGISNGTDPNTTVDYGTSIVNTAILDKMPSFPGGIEEFYKYVGTNFEKPEIDAMNTIKIYVYFVIEKDGSMTDIQVKRDPGYGLGKEAIRVLKSLKTKWTPGVINAKPVRTAYNLPITIQLQ